MTPAELELIDGHLYLAQHIARAMFANYPAEVEYDDVQGAANLGLVEAAHTYQPARGVPFKLYANTRIRGAILDMLRADRWGSRRAYERDWFVGVLVSLSRQLTPDTQTKFDDVTGRDDPDPDTDVERLLDCLTDRQRAVILSCVLGDETLARFAVRCGLTASRICQIKHEAFRAMREAV